MAVIVDNGANHTTAAAERGGRGNYSTYCGTTLAQGHLPPAGKQPLRKMEQAGHYSVEVTCQNSYPAVSKAGARLRLCIDLTLAYETGNTTPGPLRIAERPGNAK